VYLHIIIIIISKKKKKNLPWSSCLRVSIALKRHHDLGNSFFWGGGVRDRVSLAVLELTL
jgi:hypothetical protein